MSVDGFLKNFIALKNIEGIIGKFKKQFETIESKLSKTPSQMEDIENNQVVLMALIEAQTVKITDLKNRTRNDIKAVEEVFNEKTNNIHDSHVEEINRLKERLSREKNQFINDSKRDLREFRDKLDKLQREINMESKSSRIERHKLEIAMNKNLNDINMIKSEAASLKEYVTQLESNFKKDE